mmetsp:Transcript_13354/g.28658  ORF Transcript_13354/g.28658 Transcript_13354/m.28658 type:complete len:84 (+) Transcript_13354:962-1213(+)
MIRAFENSSGLEQKSAPTIAPTITEVDKIKNKIKNVMKRGMRSVFLMQIGMKYCSPIQDNTHAVMRDMTIMSKKMTRSLATLM